MNAETRDETCRELGGWLGRVLPGGRLFRTDDCLLLVRTTGFSESYRRLYFRDLEGLQVVVTGRRATVNLSLGIFAGLVFLGQAGLFGAAAGFRVRELYPVAISLAVPLAVLLALMAGNTLLGPGCQCLAHTAVQTVYLPGLSRVRDAEALLAEIAPLIARTQGTLAPAEIESRLAAAWERTTSGQGSLRRAADTTASATTAQPHSQPAATAAASAEPPASAPTPTGAAAEPAATAPAPPAAPPAGG